MRDLQVVEAQSIVPLSSIEYLDKVTPPTIQIVGGPFRGIDEVRINNQPSPSYAILNDRTIVAEVPAAYIGQSVAVSVLSSDLLGAEHVLLRFRMGKQTRSVSGLPRLIQMFARILLMTPGSSLLNPALGGGLLRALKDSYDPQEVQDLKAEAYLAVRRTQEQIQTLQARDNRAPRSERLLSANVISCTLSASSGLVLSLELKNQEGNTFLVSSVL